VFARDLARRRCVQYVHDDARDHVYLLTDAQRALVESLDGCYNLAHDIVYILDLGVATRSMWTPGLGSALFFCILPSIM
jgi:hypothetical protein